MTMTMAMAMSRVRTAWTMLTACAARDQLSTAWRKVPTALPSSRGAAAATNYRAVDTFLHAVDDWSRAAHAVNIVHAVHTLDIAIAIVIVIAKVTNTG